MAKLKFPSEPDQPRLLSVRFLTIQFQKDAEPRPGPRGYPGVARTVDTSGVSARPCLGGALSSRPSPF